MKMVACARVARKNTTNLGTVWLTMNCVPATPTMKPMSVLERPPMPTTPLDRMSWTRPARCPSGDPRRGPESATHRPPPRAPDQGRASRETRSGPRSSDRQPRRSWPGSRPQPSLGSLLCVLRGAGCKHDQHVLEAREIDRRTHGDPPVRAPALLDGFGTPDRKA